jgi:hypothetical protein
MMLTRTGAFLPTPQAKLIYSSRIMRRKRVGMNENDLSSELTTTLTAV